MKTNGRPSCKSRQSGPISLQQSAVCQGKHKHSPPQNSVSEPAGLGQLSKCEDKQMSNESDMTRVQVCGFTHCGKKHPHWNMTDASLWAYSFKTWDSSSYLMLKLQFSTSYKHGFLFHSMKTCSRLQGNMTVSSWYPKSLTQWHHFLCWMTTDVAETHTANIIPVNPWNN